MALNQAIWGNDYYVQLNYLKDTGGNLVSDATVYCFLLEQPDLDFQADDVVNLDPSNYPDGVLDYVALEPTVYDGCYLGMFEGAIIQTLVPLTRYYQRFVADWGAGSDEIAGHFQDEELLEVILGSGV